MPRRTMAALLIPLLLGSGCSLARTKVRNEGGGWQTLTRRECDWSSNGEYLSRGDAPNSPVLPIFRSRRRRYNIFALPFDLALSPIVYLTGRVCRDAGTTRRYVGTPESKRAEREALARRKRESEAALARRGSEDREAQRRRDDDERRRREEADRLARDYPPVDPAPRRGAPRPDDFALVVGVEGYRSIPRADYGENDAKLMQRYFEALGVPAANIVLLAGQGASRADLGKYLEEWLPGVVKPGSRVYFYYSGHGAPDPASGEAYLVPWDGDPAFLKSTAYPLGRVYEKLAALPAKESLVLLDSCFSGAGGRSVLAKGARPLVTVVEPAPIPGRTAVLAAAGPREIAGGLELRGHGLFSYFLMRGLGGDADADRDGALTLGELEGFVRTRVREAARRANRDQTPSLVGDAALRLY